MRHGKTRRRQPAFGLGFEWTESPCRKIAGKHRHGGVSLACVRVPAAAAQYESLLLRSP